jgi:predicted transposase/invertase (TIGR01784 family)
MYDNTCKFIAETFPADLATWLLGEPISLTKLEPSELSVEPIRADSLIFLESEEIILHAEFQTAPKPDIPFRMADYRLRAYRRYPGKQMRQIVIYLRQSGSDLVYQNTF